MKRFVKWNLSSRARQLSGGDALVVSIPKSGRTWVRTFLCAYFCERLGQPFTLEPEQYGGVPRIIYTHDLFEQRTKADRWDKLRGKYLIRTGSEIASRLSCWHAIHATLSFRSSSSSRAERKRRLKS